MTTKKTTTKTTKTPVKTTAASRKKAPAKKVVAKVEAPVVVETPVAVETHTCVMDKHDVVNSVRAHNIISTVNSLAIVLLVAGLMNGPSAIMTIIALSSLVIATIVSSIEGANLSSKVNDFNE